MCLTLNVQNFLNPKGGCMKKLLVLALVLSMATLASAGLTIIGMPTGDILVGDTVTLSVYTDAVISAGVGEWNGWGLVTETALGTISGGVSSIPAVSGLAIYDGVLAGAGFTPPEGTEGVSGAILASGEVPIPAGTIFDTITFTATAVGTANVTLLLTQDYETIGSQDAGAITIITPEPITMTLLGLGGLFLRRRSK